jgi:hypothetical protein
MDFEQLEKTYTALVAKAWKDDALKAELLSDPKRVLNENGMEMPENLEIRVVENTADTIHLILPPEPSDELSDEILADMSAGGGIGWKYCGSTLSILG